MKNIENLIVEFVKHIDVVDYICISLVLLLFLFPIYKIFKKIQNKEINNNLNKKHLKFFLAFLLLIYISLISLLVRNHIEKKNTSVESLNNKYNIFISEKDNIGFYYVPKENEVKTDRDIIGKSYFRILIEKTKDEKYYIYYNRPTDKFDILYSKEKNMKEVKKEDLKEFLNNIKKQENYKEIEKNQKLTLEDLK